MPPLVLMLIDSVFALALHHDQRAAAHPAKGFTSSRVRAEIAGPGRGEPAPGGLRIRVIINSTTADDQPHSEEVDLYVDLSEERLLASELALAELPIDRSALARVIGELESWCYVRLPLASPEPLLPG